MLSINSWLEKQLKKQFPNLRFGESYYQSGTWQTSRFIQILTPLPDTMIHYEYCIDSNWDGRIELHFEGNDWEKKYERLIDELQDRTQYSEDLTWYECYSSYRCRFSKKIDTLENLYQYLPVFMDVFDGLLQELTEKQRPMVTQQMAIKDMFDGQVTNVEIYTKKLRDVLSLPLTIPTYQRIYCWEEANVKCLLNDVFFHMDNQEKRSTPYRLGTIILHSNNGYYDIIDGQQRLITLSLIMNELGVCSKLLEETIDSKKSMEYIAYNKFLIKSYIQRNTRKIRNLSSCFLDYIEFSILVLKNASLDLAYTFFSNQNSRGVELTDYDLLKAHHLRFIPQTYELQAMRAALDWNRMIENGRSQVENSQEPDYSRTLDTFIYRLRKWMRKKECEDTSNNYRIKKEYEAAPIIEEIPPFGEQFYFNEPIQGGSHFFTYVEQHLKQYRQFIQTPEFRCVHQILNGGSIQWYRDTIESILFGYYLKFNSYFLSEALIVIMRIILQHRYLNKRAQKSSIVQYVGDSELILMIDQASSPTFFLAEARNVTKELSYPLRKDMYPIQLTVRSKAMSISQQLEKYITSNSFKTINR